MCSLKYDRDQLIEIVELSLNTSFSLWYDENEGLFSIDYPSSPTAQWIYDVDCPETADFIIEITQVVLDSIHNEG